MNPTPLLHFGRRGNTYDEADAKVAENYADKRAKMAKLLSIHEDTEEFRQLAQELCCCSGENYLNSGCIVHGLRSRGTSKNSSLKNTDGAHGGRTYKE